MIVHRMAGAVGALLLIAAVALSARAQDGFEAGVAAYERADYQRALEIFRPRAEQGDAAAQAYLGAMYRLGHGVAPDDRQSARWLLRAAEQGHAEAQYSLASLYAMGLAEPPAASELNQAADAKDLDTAIFWYRGGTRRGHAEAARWFHRAAERGLPVAQYRLATMFAGGLAVPQDLVLAHKWFSLAAAGLPPGTGRDRLIGARDQLAEDMTADQIAEAQRLVRDWTRTDE